jgi:hypothetical protein
MGFVYVIGEIRELIAEVKKRSWVDVKEEMLDVVSCSMVAFWDLLRINGWVVETRKYREWEERWNVWKKWLNDNGLEFRPEYMKFGSNYNRLEKRELVFSLASMTPVKIENGFVINLSDGTTCGLDMFDDYSWMIL